MLGKVSHPKSAPQKGDYPMKNFFNQAALSLSKINKTHLQFAMMMLTLVMLVLGAGAPEDVSGGGR